MRTAKNNCRPGSLGRAYTILVALAQEEEQTEASAFTGKSESDPAGQPTKQIHYAGALDLAIPFCGEPIEPPEPTSVADELGLEPRGMR